MVSKKIKRKPAQQESHPSTPSATMGDATTAIFLLNDYGKFGLSERVCYHFDLTEALSQSDRKKPQSEGKHDDMSHPDNVCGVVSLFECVPSTPWHRLNRRQQRALKNNLIAFNTKAKKDRDEKLTASYEPKLLPLRLNPSTRIFFAYDVTRIAFCVDASPSATSTFGTSGGLDASDVCCPLDRLPGMARTFFRSLVEPVLAPSLGDQAAWHPNVAVSVIAIFPLGQHSETSLLVRDFRIHDLESADLLAAKVERWTRTEVESGIARRISRCHVANTWTVPLYSSSLKDIVEAGDGALDILSSEARPCLVVATDGRSISCDGVKDVFLDVDRVDIPLIVLDLSDPKSHAQSTPDQDSRSIKEIENNFLSYDPGGPSAFPLHLSDDTEELYGICRATGGCFFDSQLLLEAANNLLGKPLASESSGGGGGDNLFSYKRKFVKMNGVQWLTLFSLSRLSPTFHSFWGKVAPPKYLRDTLRKEEAKEKSSHFRDDLYLKQFQDSRRASPIDSFQNRSDARVTFSTYIVSPVRIKGLLLMRIKEGYRAKQYGQSTQDPDKVFIQFSLPLVLGAVLHYELSYKASSSRNHMVGSAHVKIELSGDPNFIQAVKSDFIQHTNENRKVYSVAQKISQKLCHVLRCIRTEDCLQSYLCPPEQWSGQFDGPEKPFIKRLGGLSSVQRRRHFHRNQFDVVCTGNMPYTQDDYILSEFIDTDTGEHQLCEMIAEWATQKVAKDQAIYVKQLSPQDDMTGYCIIEVCKSPVASRLFTVKIELFAGNNPSDRHLILADLKRKLNDLKDVEVLEKQMGKSLVGSTNSGYFRRHRVDVQYHHARWDLIKNAELLQLLMKRRHEIGSFRLLESSDQHALFAKLVPPSSGPKQKWINSPGDLVQYHIAILEDEVVVDLHMESESSKFFPFTAPSSDSRFHIMAENLRRRDQECGRALRSRTNLLRVLDSDLSFCGEEDHVDSVKRLLQYSSQVSRDLRFFSNDNETANSALLQLTEKLILHGSLGVHAGKLDIDQNLSIKEFPPGIWFAVRFDRDTMGIIHVSLVNKHTEISESESSFTFREMTYFTIGISDLYSKRDDVIDDDSVDSHISEYLCVTEFADLVDTEHRRNYSMAAYLSQRIEIQPFTSYFTPHDIDSILEPLKFVEMVSIVVPGAGKAEFLDPDKESKLARDLSLLLLPLRGTEHYFYYCSSTENEGLFRVDSESLNSAEDGSTLMEDETKQGMVQYDDNDRTTKNEDELEKADSLSQSSESSSFCEFSNENRAPIFFRFRIDGVLASVKELYSLTKRAKLTAEVSILEHAASISYDIGGILESSISLDHQIATLQLGDLLKSYVAEQTLERMLGLGSGISNEELNVVKKCMKRVRNVVSLSIEVFFYISKTDAMVPASAPAGGEASVSEGMRQLTTEVLNNSALLMRRVPGGGFVVYSKGASDPGLTYWCFVKINHTDGVIIAEVYHHEGEDEALHILAKAHDVISSAAHRVNQQLLLDSLHQSRSASLLLITNSVDGTEEGAEMQVPTRFPPGAFSCPVVYRNSFCLYHRAASNPQQVARKLESTVLRSFAILNRGGVFVYKDESGKIFYMTLEALEDSNEDGGQVHLLVQGIDQPGPEFTTPLTRILQRKLMLIAVEILSSLLQTKSDLFAWKKADFDFIETFAPTWNALEDDHQEEVPQDYFYEFPQEATDPYLVLLMFRQNLCGSTFFHRLCITTEEDGKFQTLPVEGSAPHPGIPFTTTMGNDLTFYYNSIPSKPDPNLQGVSTLTMKGQEFSRLTGNGIAVVEVSLLGSNLWSNGDKAPARCTTEEMGQRDLYTSSPTTLRFKRGESLQDAPWTLRVRITDTALKRQHLHDWIALCLNQSLIDWAVERQIEMSSMVCTQHLSSRLRTILSEKDKRQSLNSLCPGLPHLMQIFDSSHDLPQPTISKVDLRGVVRASAVASTTLHLLENSLFTAIVSESNSNVSAAMLMDNLKIVRLSRSEKPQLVSLSRDSATNKMLVSFRSRGGLPVSIQDSPIDCPEYICYYCSSRRNDENTCPSMMYSTIAIDERASCESRTTLEYLANLKQDRATILQRSFAFVFSCKRNRRVLWTFNWTPQMLKTASSKLRDEDRSRLYETANASFLLQSRSLKILTPSNSGLKQKDVVAVPTGSSNVAAETKGKVASQTESGGPSKHSAPQETRTENPGRRIRRPITMRRPKLVGKSVEGAAAHAFAASRARASSNQFKTISKPSSNQSKRPQKDTKSSSSQGHRKDGPQASDKVQASRPPRRKDSARRKSEVLLRIESDYRMLVATANASIHLQTLHALALHRLVTHWWNQAPPAVPIPICVLQFFTMRAPCTSIQLASMPQLPNALEIRFLAVFGQWVSRWTKQLSFVHVLLDQNNRSPRSVYLVSPAKNVHGCKCFVLIEIARTLQKQSGGHDNVMKVSSWILTLPRRRQSKTKERSKRLSPTGSASRRARDATGMDMLSSSVMAVANLETLLFDFFASFVERSVRLLDQRFDCTELLVLLKRILCQYPLEKQKRMPRAEYRVFEATIVLKSYGDRLIDMFDSSTLLNYTCADCDKRGLLKCGDALCFRNGMTVHGTYSTCFLALNAEEKGKMQIIILCRTRGRNLSEYVFRDDSNVAIHLLDNIAVEAAKLVYLELSCSAKRLRLEYLWRSLSSCANANELQSDSIVELLTLCYVRPLHQALDSCTATTYVQSLMEVLGSKYELDWLSCMDAMARDPSFSPCQTLEMGTDLHSVLFRMESDDVFLLLAVHESSRSLHTANLIEKDRLASNETVSLTVQKFANFVIHFIYTTL